MMFRPFRTIVGLLLLFAPALFAARPIPTASAAAACTPGGIQNFRAASNQLAPRQVTFTWDAPAGAPAGTVYELVVMTTPTYCTPVNGIPPAFVYSTTALTYTVPMNLANTVYTVYAREAADNCITSANSWQFDTFDAAPQTPAAPAVTTDGVAVSLTFSYSDPHAWVVVERAFNGGAFAPINSGQAYDGCAPDPKSAFDPTLTPGAYQYRLRAKNDGTATGRSGVFSPIVNITVGPLRIASFTAAPTSVRLGQSATLSWSVEGATSVTIDNGVGANLPANGSTTVQPSVTTTYKLTATQGSSSTTSTVTVEVITTPVIVVTALPQPIVQPQASGGATTSYAVTNSGGAGATVTLTQSGSFFTQQPSTFTLAPGATQIVTITGIASAAGAFDGASILSTGLQVPVHLLSVAPPSGTATADAVSPRVDVAGVSGSSPAGSVAFTNHGTSTLTGVLSADVPWIVPQTGPVTIAPGATGTFSFFVDRSKRASATFGSAEGNLTISYLKGQPFGKRALDGNPSDVSIDLVRVIDTVQSSVAPASVPPLGAGEIGLVVPDIGHTTRQIQGTRTTFASDMSLLNPQGTRALEDVKFFFTPQSGASQTTTLPSTPANVSIQVADVVKNVFGGDEQTGSLHIRSKAAATMAVAASALAANSTSGTVGTDLPVFRSDRAAANGETVVLTGLRRDAFTFTDLYVQEMLGNAATVQIDYYTADGTAVGTTSTQTVEPFRVLELSNAIPQNAVAAVVKNVSTTGAAIFAYATIADGNNGDMWLVTDWSRQLGYAASQPVVIPIAGTVHGANSTFYRTDLAIMNRGTSTATGTLRFVPSSGDPVEQQISLGPLQTNVITDVLATRFNIANDAAGYIIFTPATGSFALSARAYSTTTGKAGTFSAEVPVVSAAASLRRGGSQAIASLQEADRRNPDANPARPGTFRTNFALLETAGQTATVHVTLKFTYAVDKAGTVGSAERDFILGPNQFMLLNSIADQVIGPDRSKYRDMRGIEADFQVTSGDGAVVLFTSSVDNATGDSIIRMQ